MRLVLQSASHNSLGRHIFSGIDDVEAVIAQQQGHDVLADIVDVPFHRRHHDDGPLFGPATFFKQRFKFGEGRLHGLGRTDELRQEILPLFVAVAHFRNGRDEHLVDQGKGLGPLFKFRAKERQHVLLVALQHGLAHRRRARRRGHGGRRIGRGRLPLGIAGDEDGRVGIVSAQHIKGIKGFMQACGGRIGDAGAQPRPRSHAEEGGIEQVTGRQAEGKVGKPQRGGQALLPAPADHVQTGQRPFRLGRDGQRQDVHQHETPGDAQGFRLAQQLLQDGDALGGADGQLRALEREQDEGRAEIPAQRAELFHTPALPAYGVNQTGARAIGQRGGDGVGIGGIERKRRRNALHKAAGQLRQELAFVHEGGPHVDVQHLRPGRDLLVGETEGFIKAAFLQLGGELLLTCGIDALADDDEGGLGRKAHELRAAGQTHARRGGWGGRRELHPVERLPQGGQMPRRGAAAAAEDPRPLRGEARRLFGEFLRPQREDRHAVAQFRQTGIGLDHDRTGADIQQLAHHGRHLIRPKAAVGPHHVHAEVLHGLGKDGRAGAGEAHPLLEGHGDHDRQVAYLTRRHHGGTGLGKVELRLHQQQVAAAGHQTADLRGKGGDQVGRLHIAQRTGKMTGRPHIAGHEDPARTAGRRGPGRLDHAAAEIEDVQTGGQLVGIAAEGAGRDDVRPHIHIGGMDILQDVRPLHAEFFRADAKRQSCGLEHGSHGSIKHERTFFRESVQERRC